MMKKHTMTDPETWVREYGDYLFKYAIMRLRDTTVAEDVVQETFLAAYQGRKRFSGRSTVRTWLVGILKHKIVNYIRKASRERVIDNSDDFLKPAEDFFDRKGKWKVSPAEWKINPRKALEQEEFWDVFNKCLAALQPRLHEVFVLREIEGLSADEICEQLDISQSNLWVSLFRARQQLRGLLEQSWLNMEPKAEALAALQHARV